MLLTIQFDVKKINPLFLARKIKNIAYKLSISRIRGFDLHLNSPDRIVLEDTILPYLVSCSNLQKVLFVGCDWYTQPYKKIFKNKEYWTIEINERNKKYGSKNHIVDRLQNLSNYVKSDYFDLIIYNGVFGFGTNTREDTEESFKQCFQALRKGGVLVFGWNDVPQYKPFPVLEECENLKKFEPYIFPALSTSQYLTPNTEFRHTYNFYTKPK
jgi:SAM-dependent methyltransferase